MNWFSLFLIDHGKTGALAGRYAASRALQQNGDPVFTSSLETHPHTPIPAQHKESIHLSTAMTADSLGYMSNWIILRNLHF